MSEQSLNMLQRQLTGAERAAVVLRELGKDVAVTVLEHMDDATIGRISAAMARLRKMPRTATDEIMSAFAADLGAGGDSNVGYRYFGKMLAAALGEARAQESAAPPSRNEVAAPFNAQINADPRALAIQMASERPQTLALLLAQLPHDTGAAMLSFLPEKLAAEAVYRFSKLDAVSPEAVSELHGMLAERMANNGDDGRRSADLGGAKQTADILNHLQSELSERVLEDIMARDRETADKIRENLFTFLDVVKLSDRALQLLLREVPGDSLAPALRLVDESVRVRFFQNMSSRTVEVLSEELKSGPPMRRADVLSAQSKIVEVALKLAADGKISINGSEELV
ncbi:MAG TPA: FliG C-terminal domain-containing protein [Acidocella sp.]|nr:FliG C-terminal domain-containing protein [Acidocella sp.]